ncbi:MULTISPECIES: translocation/assembly module TamB domain-containing protein [Sphingomonas]|uniref:translocation/assembly module TamB domain-containing protein n=1 Tax=Sphingomonas TaxID=13687 RepID=UPI001F075C46|nr:MULTISPECIES: translocation/assembly module TamB domain-containing protein [Sphingomonas]
MDDVDHTAPVRVVRVRRPWWQRLLTELAVLVALLGLLAAVAVAILDSAPGHRWVADRLAEQETATGLKIRVGRIDGSLFGVMHLRNVAVADTRGVFLTSPDIAVDWAPGAWLYRNLHIDSVDAQRVTLVRLPVTRPSLRRGPLLPDFDIELGRLRIARLELLKGVTGTPRIGTVDGRAVIRAGRAMVDLDARLSGGGDALMLRLDAEPDRDRFDLGLNLAAPADGLVPALTGIRRPLGVRIAGAGQWSKWNGVGEMDVAGKPFARLRLAATSGLYRLRGQAAPTLLLKGRLARLTAPRVAIDGEGRLADRVLDGRLTLASASLRAVARGGVDLAGGAYRQLRLGVDLLRPEALFGNMRGRQVRLVWTLDGAFDRAAYSYRLTSPGVTFDNTGFTDVRAEGRGRLTPWPMRVPLRLAARAITGIGNDASAILANARLEGMLQLTSQAIRGDRLRLTSDKLSADLSLLIDLATGRFDVLVNGGLARYFIPGLGVVDVTSQLHVEPGPGGHGSRVVGTGRAQVRRLDNAFFRSMTGGLPRIEARLERGPDGVLHFPELQLFSPKLRLSGSGYRRKDGTFVIDATGRQAEYGPVRLHLDGPIERPRIELLLARPNDTLGLKDVRLSLMPNGRNFDFRAAGGSRLGPFTGSGSLLLPPGGDATIAIAALDVAGTRASGQLQPVGGALAGQLALTGGGLGGRLLFAPASGGQRIEAHLQASGFASAGPPALAVREGELDGVILIVAGRTSVNGTLSARGLETTGVSLARLTASASLTDGRGQVRANFAGRRGNAFQFAATADVAPEQITVRGNGAIEGRALALTSPAVLTATADGWRIAPTQLRFAGGSATVAGATGRNPQLSADLSAMPMSVLDLIWPRLELGGVASGRLAYGWNGGRPHGQINVTVRGLSRAGLVLASQPIDVGIAAVLDGSQAGMRAVAVSNGQTIGRAQARFAPLNGDTLIASLMNAPLFAQLRYSGPADTLWRLSGTELFDLSGPVAIGADVRGSLVDPQIRGSLRTTQARLESAVTGTVITDLAASGNFVGSRLVFQQLQGRTPGNGTIAGAGSVDLSGGRPALDLRFQTKAARILARDDIAADVTGPLAIRSDGTGGTISGDLSLNRGRFTLGRASAAAAVPQLAVRDVGIDSDAVIEEAELKPWRLDVGVRGGELTVQGLGIDSRWTTDLRVGGSVAAPRFTGTAGLVRGSYDFAGRSFRLSRGTIRFRGESPPDPQLDIAAEAQIQGLDASVVVRGTGLKPEISFTSVPQLPQDELLSRLLFGTSIANLSAGDALQLAAAVAGLREGRSGSLDPINAIRRAAGLDRLRILPADIATGQKTAISAGKYLTRKLFVEVITDGQGYSATRVEYQVTRWLSLLSSISTIGRTSANVRVSKDY